MNPQELVITWNRLLGAELAAVESYGQALDRFRDESVTPIFMEFRDDHLNCATWWRDWIQRHGGTSAADPGAECRFARPIGSHDCLFGEASVLAALLHGEEQGRRAYEALLGGGGVPPPVFDVVRTVFLPRQRRRVTILRELTAT